MGEDFAGKRPVSAVRSARRGDAPAITAIYNQGIEDRIGTFETEPRSVSEIEAWFDHAKAFVAVENSAGEVVGYAVAHPYADRCCYAGIGEFSVYVRRDHRGAGVGRVAMNALVDASRDSGLWKLLSRVFPENRASLESHGLVRLQGDRRPRKARQARRRMARLRDRRAADCGERGLATWTSAAKRWRPEIGAWR